MKINRHQLCVGLLCLIVFLGIGVYCLTNRSEETAGIYNESLQGIPYYPGQELIQNNMTEDGNSNTEGAMTYIIRNAKESPSHIYQYFQEHVDQKKWKVTPLKSQSEDFMQLQFESTSELVLSTTHVIIMQSNEDILITLLSYYDDNKILEKSKAQEGK